MGAIIEIVNDPCLLMEMHLCIFSHYTFRIVCCYLILYICCVCLLFCLVLLYSSYMEEIKIIIYYYSLTIILHVTRQLTRGKNRRSTHYK